MYTSLIFSFNKLKDKSGIDTNKIKFPGFDGNRKQIKLFTQDIS